jgi:hypothetical protein
MIYTATTLLRSDDLRGNYLVSNWIGSDPERVADYNGIHATNDEMRSPLLNNSQFQFVMHSSSLR